MSAESGRALGPIERVFEWSNALGAACHVVAVQIEGDLDDGHLQQAIAHLQRRHPMLSARIVQDPAGACRFDFEDPAPVSLERDPRPWRQVFEDLLHHRFESETGPLWRLLRPEEPDVLVAAFHHASEDGLSTLTFFRELLGACRALAHDEDLPDPGRAPVLPTVEARLGGRLTWRVKLRFLFREAARRLVRPQMLIEAEAPVEARRTRFEGRTLGQEVIGALVDRCRQEQTTVQGILSAAMLMAAAARCTGDPAWLSCDANVDLRRLCDPPIAPEHIGMCIGSVSWMFRVGAGTGIWALAREVRGRLVQMIARGDPRDNMLLIDWAGFEPSWIARGASRGSGRQQSVFVSNLGRSDLSGEATPRVVRMHYSIGQHGMGACFWVGAVSLGGRLDLSFVWAEPMVGAQTARGFVEEVVGLLEAAASPKDLLLDGE